jgi:hypothetical protein
VNRVEFKRGVTSKQTQAGDEFKIAAGDLDVTLNLGGARGFLATSSRKDVLGAPLDRDHAELSHL